jgi:4-hydroxy-4-methyl-2-oxoglutarate aldolase
MGSAGGRQDRLAVGTGARDGWANWGGVAAERLTGRLTHGTRIEMNADCEQTLRRYRRLDTCVVSDALDALDLPGGGALSLLHPMWEGARLVGRAVTVLLAPGPAAAGGPHLGARAIEAASPGEVIVVANAGRTQMGSWGGLLCVAAAARGIAGVVADGAIRDVDEARQLQFAAFARAATPRTARGRVHEEACNVAVDLAGVPVEPGDLITADGSGVVIVPWASAQPVLDKAESIVERELKMAELLRGGAPPTDVLGRSYESMLGDTPAGRRS